MNISNWLPYFKIDPDDRVRCMAQQTYEPLISPDKKFFCANYDYQNKYQKTENSIRPRYTKEIVDYFFDQEILYLKKHINETFTPSIIDIDYKKKRIFFLWEGETCNEIIYSNRNLQEYCPDWKEQLKNIEVTLFQKGTYKLTAYAHSHFVNKEGNLKAIDWYGCVPVSDYWIESKWMNAIIHSSAIFRIKEIGGIINGKYDLEKMFKNSLLTHIKWGEQDLSYIYREIFKEHD